MITYTFWLYLYFDDNLMTYVSDVLTGTIMYISRHLLIYFVMFSYNLFVSNKHTVYTITKMMADFENLNAGSLRLNNFRLVKK